MPKWSSDTDICRASARMLVYRDPWGNPYIITMDLNYDEQCQDAFYCQQAVSQNLNPTVSRVSMDCSILIPNGNS